MNTLNPKPIEFKLGEYISQGFELMKKDFGTILLSFLCAAILSMIPFLGLMAFGNFYKICYKIDKGIPASAGEIFNFDDFMPYFIFQVYIFAAVFIVMIPVFFFIPFMENTDNSFAPFLFILYFVPVYIVLIYFMLKAFYIPALITFKKITDIKTAWNISKTMAKENLLMIFLFVIVVSFLAQIGMLACFVGIIFTMPFHYVAQYFAFKDGLEQVERDSI